MKAVFAGTSDWSCSLSLSHTAARAGLPTVLSVYEPGGCDACRRIGFRGRTAIYEVLDAADLFRHVKERRTSLQDLTNQALARGLRTLRQNGLRKVLSGETSLEEILKVTADY